MLQPTTTFERQQLVARLVDLLSAHTEIDFAYIFGTFVEEMPYHDVDVAVFLFPAATSMTDLFEYEMKLSTELTLALHMSVDVHVLNGVPMGVRYTVVQGDLLFARDEERLTDYIEQVGWETMPFAYYVEAYLKDVLS
jgi:predicted nucleotidyltransferase